ncbi:MAG: MlaD family protein [Candidatus Caenarcaniphilales bacterium]|jgi:ABC-type transporter Mla subunit MlaD|nr:MlaD family protein [Candidatus Caenarcaniphilales bacterium]
MSKDQESSASMNKINKEELSKIGTVAILGLVALIAIIVWLKGHKIYNYNKYTFYFRNVNGLQEGNALRWNGLKIGVVDSIYPVRKSFTQEPLPVSALIGLGKRHLDRAREMLTSSEIEDLVLAQEEVNKAQLEITLGKSSSMQEDIIAGRHVAVTVSVTTPNVPIGQLNQVTIVPSGVIGEQYVDITTIDTDPEYRNQFASDSPRFVVLEPVRLDTLIRVNAESAEAVSNLSNRLNALFSDDDAQNIKVLIDNSAQIAGDKKLRSDIRKSVNNINEITHDFTIWRFLGLNKKKHK